MKNPKILLGTLLILPLLIMAGCQGEEPATVQPGEQVKNVPNTLQADPQTSLSAETTTTANTDADTINYNGAVKLLDASLCDKITDAAYLDKCKTTVQIQQAISNKDPSLCEKLSSKDLIDSCKAQIEVKKRTDEAAFAVQEKVNQEQALSQSIQQKGDVTQCKQLTDQNFLRTCEYNIVTNEALQTRDKSICRRASDSTVISKCEQEIDSVGLVQ